jgi:hypothetical protein
MDAGSVILRWCAFAPALRVLAPVLRETTQFVWRVTRLNISNWNGW